jgi:hypothetical protein
MSPRDLFGVIVRTGGLVSLFYGCRYLVFGLVTGLDALDQSLSDDARFYIMVGIPFIAAGCFLMRGADWVVSFCYPVATAASEDGERPDTRTAE